jgi:hypothetical protein
MPCALEKPQARWLSSTLNLVAYLEETMVLIAFRCSSSDFCYAIISGTKDKPELEGKSEKEWEAMIAGWSELD